MANRCLFKFHRQSVNGFIHIACRSIPFIIKNTRSSWLAFVSVHSSTSINKFVFNKPLQTCIKHNPLLSWQCLATRTISYGGDHELSTVEMELERASKGKKEEQGVKERQMALFKALISDLSEPTVKLIAKINCETKLSPEEAYTLGVAVCEARNHVSDGSHLMQLAANLFGYAGEQGEHNALYTYAQLLRIGQGVKVNLTKAAELLSDLSMKGHPYAQFALGGMFYSGSGVAQCYKKAYTLYKVSAQNYVPEAYNIIGNMHRFGQGVEENIALAVEYYQKGCEMGDSLAYISMAHCHAHGKGVKLSQEKAFENYLEASKSNNPLALYNVGTHYFSGQGVKQDLKKAVEYYEKAAMVGFSPAQVNLGNMYYSGIGVAKNREKAKELFQLAADTDENAKGLLEMIKEEEKKDKS